MLIVVVAEIGRRTASYDGGHDLSSLAENHLFDISLCAGLVAYMGVAVVTAIREFGRIGADEYLAQPVAAILLGRADPDVDAVRPLPNMTERILDSAEP